MNIIGKRRIFAMFGALMFSNPASAQNIITGSLTMDGRADVGDGPSSSGSRWAMIDVVSAKGSKWDILVTSSDFQPSMLLWNGSCETPIQAMKVLTSGDREGKGNRLRFISGGGAYCLTVLSQSGAGGYRMVTMVKPGDPGSAKLPAGAELGPWRYPDWKPTTASTSFSSNASGRKAGAILRDCDDACPEMVVIPAGTGLIGSSAEEDGRRANEGPRHSVTFAAPFAVGRYEVTFAEYDACVVAGGCTYRPSDQGWGRGRRPVIDVNWNDAQHYVAWLSTKTQQRYHLLSESEWEYAARAGTSTPWNTGSAIVTDDANFLDAFKQTVPVGGFPANAFGLHDMHGNVFEWVSDCIEVGYFGAPTNGNALNSAGCARVLRGGSFKDQPRNLRSAFRTYGQAFSRGSYVGFRVARSL